jgi:hypothetical protein
MGKTVYADTHGHAILLDQSHNPLSSEDEVGVVLPITFTDDFILAVQVGVSGCGSDLTTSAIRLDFSEDGGAWTPVSNTTVAIENAVAGLTNNSAYVAEACSSGMPTCGTASFAYHWECTDGAGYSTAAAGTWQEIWFGIKLANVTQGSTYTFRLWNVTDGAELSGTFSLSIYIATYDVYEVDISGDLGLSVPKHATEGGIIEAGITGALALDYYQTKSGPRLNPDDKGSGAFVNYVNYPGDSVYVDTTSGLMAARSAEYKAGGKWYFEIQARPHAGITTYTSVSGIGLITASVSTIPGGNTLSWGYQRQSAGIGYFKHENATQGTLFPDPPEDVTPRVMWAVDLDAGKIWIGEDGVWSGDPAAGTGEAFQDNDLTTNNIYIIVSGYYSTTYNEMMTIHAGPNSDQLYSPPSGFAVWTQDGVEDEVPIGFDILSTIVNSGVTVNGIYGQELSRYGYSYSAYLARSNLFVPRQSSKRFYGEFVNYEAPDAANFDGIYIGFGTSSAPTSNTTYTNPLFGASADDGVLFKVQEYSGTNIRIYRLVGSTSTFIQTFYTQMTATTTVMLAADFETGDIWIGIDGTWANSGDPEAGINPTYTYPDISDDIYLLGAVSRNLAATPERFDVKCIVYDSLTLGPPSGFPAGFGDRKKGTYELDITAALDLTLDSFDGIYYGNHHYAEILASIGSDFAKDRNIQIIDSVFWDVAASSSEVEFAGLFFEQAWQQENTSSWHPVVGVTSRTSGKYYAEFHLINDTDFGISVGVANLSWSGNIRVGWDTAGNSWGIYIYDSGADIYVKKYHGSSTGTDLETYAGNLDSSMVIVMVAVDFNYNGGTIWFGHNGSWYNGDPNTPTGGCFSGLSSEELRLAAAVFWNGQSRVTAEGVCGPPEYMPSGYTYWESLENHEVYDEYLAGFIGANEVIQGDAFIVASILGATGFTEQTYYGEGVEFLVGISGDLGSGFVLSPGGSSYHGEIAGNIGIDESDASEWDWETTLFRYLDGRPGQVGTRLGFYPKANVYGENYFLYFDHASRSYELTISGGPGPVVIPMVSFQIKLRDSIPSSLNVQIVGPYADEILARAGGSMSLDIIWRYKGNELTRETMVSVGITDVQVRKRATQTSANVHGSGVREYPGAKEIQLSGVQYEAFTGGMLRYRASFDPDLFPGDTVRADMINFIAAVVSLSVTIDKDGTVLETMEVGESE